MIYFHQSVDDAQAYSVAPNIIVDFSYRVTLKNVGTSTVYLGDSGVDSSAGWGLAANATVTLTANETLYMRCASSQSTTVHVLLLKS